MKKIVITILAVLLFCGSNTMAQTPVSSTPDGLVIYSLPNTSINLVVEATKETFIAGPYAQYAQKYLGTAAKTENAVTYSMSSIQFHPYIEADPSSRIAINLSGKKNATANFLQFCSQGLIIASDSYTGKPEAWRFPSIATGDQFAGKGVGGNLTSTTTTLYKSVMTESGFQRVPVEQKQVVEKSTEKKAEEVAASIFNLRRKRTEIITGDTDAIFNGEALGAAIEEINRLEQEYLSLFFGITETSIQKMSFDVVPQAGNDKHIYVAFRISETQGLLPASNISGRPIILELILDEGARSTTVQQAVAASAGRSKGQMIYYRVPATVTARILDGQQTLLQTRVPVYQLGAVHSFPIETLISN